jgi:hypothetical protein
MTLVIPVGACPAADRLEAWETTLLENETALIQRVPGTGVAPARREGFPGQGALLRRNPTLSGRAAAERTAGLVIESTSS